MKKKALLLTGSAGFIGYHVTHELLKEGHVVVGVDNFNDYYNPALKKARSEILHKYPQFIEKRIDLSHLEALEALFREYQFTHICHLAAQAGVRHSLTNPFIYQQANLAAFLNILEMTRHFGVKKLVYASSSSVYGGNKKIPFSEKDNVDHPISLYAATKRANELMAHSYTHLYGFQTIGLRFFTVYGPWGRPDMAMWLFTEAMKSGKPIQVFNHGNMKRDFTYIDDIVQGVCSSIFTENLDKYEIFNLGNHKSEDIMQMIAIIESELKIKAEKEMLPMQSGDVPEAFADIENARLKLGFKPETSISEGIPAFISWYNNHPGLTDMVRDQR